jgi:hypothetical protein
VSRLPRTSLFVLCLPAEGSSLGLRKTTVTVRESVETRIANSFHAHGFAAVRKKEKAMSLKKRGKTWHTHFFVDGQRFRQSLETSDWREAQK